MTEIAVGGGSGHGMNWIKAVTDYKPYNEQEEKDKEIVVNLMGVFDDILTRGNKIAHLTSSAFVVNRKRDKVLMVHHNIFNSWSWTGGHADGEEDLLSVAVNEVKEETGVQNVRLIGKDIASLDIIPVLGHARRGEYVAPHLHISIAFLLEADENEPLVVKPDENSGVQWIPIEQIDKFSNEPHMIRIYSKITARIEELSSV